MKLFNSLFAIIIVAIVALSTLNIIKISAISVSAPKREYAQVVVNVIDEKTKKPIQNAKINIVESKTNHYTDRLGNTEAITVPFIRNAAFDTVLPQDWGEVTIIIKASGYADYLMCRVKVRAGNRRMGIVAYLKQIINEDDNKLTVIVEQPDEIWTSVLVDLV